MGMRIGLGYLCSTQPMNLTQGVRRTNMELSILLKEIQIPRWIIMNKLMCRALGITVVTLAVFCASAYSEAPPPVVSDQEILDYASRPFNKYNIAQSRVILGLHKGTTVAVDFICSDLCPEYTVRVIHYELGNEHKCSDIGGIEKKVRVPVAIAAMDKTFCFPKILADNWKSYTKNQ